MSNHWRHPLGPENDLKDTQNFPVVHIAYRNAKAYAKGAGKRLPPCRPNGKWMANTHPGHFPDHDTGEDGFVGIAPVAKYPANHYGLFDMAGNVWKWTSDWDRPDYRQALVADDGVARNPRGPDSAFDPAEPDQAKKVLCGGSFLCTDQYCSRYMWELAAKGKLAREQIISGSVV
jgi:sulfatase modifying factor 1